MYKISFVKLIFSSFMMLAVLILKMEIFYIKVHQSL